MKHLRAALEDNLAAQDSSETQEQPVVVMVGSLSNIYTRALNLAFAKIEDTPVEAAVESQAIDAAVRSQATSSDQDDEVIEIPYFYNPSTSKDEEGIEVSKALNQISKKNIEFIFYQDETIPSVMAGQPSEGKGERMMAIESIEVRVRLKKLS